MARNYNKLCKFSVSKKIDNDDNVNNGKHGIRSPPAKSYRPRDYEVHRVYTH